MILINRKSEEVCNVLELRYRMQEVRGKGTDRGAFNGCPKR